MANLPHSSATSTGSAGSAGCSGTDASTGVSRPSLSTTTIDATPAPRAGHSPTDGMSAVVAKWNSPRTGPGKKATWVPNSLRTTRFTGATCAHQAAGSRAARAAGSKNSQNSTSLCSSP